MNKILAWLLLLCLMLSPAGCSQQTIQTLPTGTVESTSQLPKNTEISLLEHGKVQHTITSLSADELALMEAIIMDFSLRSAAWPAIDIRAIAKGYQIHLPYAEGTVSDYYIFMNDSKAAVQFGADGHYSYIDTALFEKLEALFQNRKGTP